MMPTPLAQTYEQPPYEAPPGYGYLWIYKEDGKLYAVRFEEPQAVPYVLNRQGAWERLAVH